MSNDPREIAAVVGAAAVELLEPLEYLPMYVDVVGRGWKVFGEEAEEYVIGTRDELREAAAELGAIFDTYAAWWVADRPPAFWPRAASVVEGLLLVANRLVAALDAADVRDLAARCLWAHRHWTGADSSELEAELRCEVATMARRSPPSPADGDLWAKVFAKAGLPTYSHIVNSSRGWAVSELPPLWSKMSEEERVAAIRNPPDVDPQPPRLRTDRPQWRPELNVLTCHVGGAEVTARHFRKRAAPNQARLLAALEAADWPSSGVSVPGLAAEQLDDAVTSFNSSVAPNTVRLTRHGRGGVGWCWATEKQR